MKLEEYEAFLQTKLSWIDKTRVRISHNVESAQTLPAVYAAARDLNGCIQLCRAEAEARLGSECLCHDKVSAYECNACARARVGLTAEVKTLRMSLTTLEKEARQLEETNKSLRTKVEKPERKETSLQQQLDGARCKQRHTQDQLYKLQQQTSERDAMPSTINNY